MKYLLLWIFLLMTLTLGQMKVPAIKAQAEEQPNYVEVHATVYHAVPEQTNEDPEHTAFMFHLDLSDPYKHRIVAVSRDLLILFPNGTKIEITCDTIPTDYDGIYTVRDKMNKRYTSRIDILINEGMQIGSWKNAKIRKL